MNRLCLVQDSDCRQRPARLHAETPVSGGRGGWRTQHPWHQYIRTPQLLLLVSGGINSFYRNLITLALLYRVEDIVAIPDGCAG